MSVYCNERIFRQSAAYLASLGGYDEHERPHVPLLPAVNMMKGLAEILGMSHEQLALKIDEARVASLEDRLMAGEITREKGSRGPSSYRPSARLELVER